MPDPSRLIVVGVPRSGTTLLTCMLGWNSSCIAMNECFSCQEGKIVSPADVIVNKLCCPTQIQLEHSFLNNILQPYLTLWWKIPLSSLTGLVLTDRPYGRMSISEYAEERDASFLFILREPNQVVHSLIQRAELRESKATSRWAHGIREISKSYSRYHANSYVVNFSNLTHNTTYELEKICDFVGLEYEDRMKKGYKSNPTYDIEGIDEFVSEKEVPNYEIKSKYPDEYSLYVSLNSDS